jgi:ribonuclease T
MAERFRGYLPVVVDVETGGFNSATDALLEIAAVTIGMDEKGFLFPEHTYFFRVEPFEGANIERPRWNSPGSSSTTRCAWRSAKKAR